MKGRFCSKANQYTRASMLHWEIMQLRLVIGLVVLLSMGAVVGVAHEVLTPAAKLDSGSFLVEIPAHDGVLDIAGRLYAAGVIRSRVGFVLLAVVRGTSRQLKAGEYELARGASTLDVLSQIEAGRVKQHLVLHPEGATLTELARVLESAEDQHAAAGRPHGSVRDRQGAASAYARRSGDGPSLQHVPPARPAAGADRQPGPRRNRSGPRPGAREVPVLRRDGRSSSLLLGFARRAQRGRRPVPARPRSVNRAIKRATWPVRPRLPRTGGSPTRRRRRPFCIARSVARFAGRSRAGSTSVSKDSSIFRPVAPISSPRITTTIWTGSSSASPRPSRSRFW